MCSFCHNPNLTEPDNGKDVSWNLVNMIHRSHAEVVRYPGNLNNCNQCHVGNSQTPPLDAALLPVKDGMAPSTPVLPTTNACMSCPNTSDAWGPREVQHHQTRRELLGVPRQRQGIHGQ